MRRRVGYVFGGRLPDTYLSWVYRDLTGPGWRHRHALRSAVSAVPFALVFLLLRGPWVLKVTLVVALPLASLVMGYATSSYSRNRRLQQHGFAPVHPPEEDEFEPPADGTPPR